MGEGGLTRPRLGILFVTSGWFREIGLQGAESDTSAEVERTARRAVERIGGFAETVFSGVLFSREDAEAAARAIQAAGVDAVLVSPLMWCEDAIPRSALDMLKGVPLILWIFSPLSTLAERVPFQTMLRGSGPVGAMQLSGMLKREGIPFHPVAGNAEDHAVYREIETLARAAAARRRLHGARIGVLPFPCDQMSVTWVDEFGLRARHGIELRPLELRRVRDAAAGCTAAEVRALCDEITAAGARVDVDGRNLEEGARYALALDRVRREERLSAIAMNDVIPEMHECFGLRPCLHSPALSREAVVTMETDIGAAVCMLALGLFTGEPPFYTEPLSVDYGADCLLMGHAGYHDPRNADPSFPVRIINDVEYESSDRFTGAATYFKYRPGEATVVSSVWGGHGLSWSCVEGTSEAGPPRLEGNCHLVFRPDARVKDFLQWAVRRGVSQHWIVVPGRRAVDLGLLCGMLGIGFEALAR
jgi:L-fucose isomerase-like protein